MEWHGFRPLVLFYRPMKFHKIADCSCHIVPWVADYICLVYFAIEKVLFIVSVISIGDFVLWIIFCSWLQESPFPSISRILLFNLLTDILSTFVRYPPMRHQSSTKIIRAFLSFAVPYSSISAHPILHMCHYSFLCVFLALSLFLLLCGFQWKDFFLFCACILKSQP